MDASTAVSGTDGAVSQDALLHDIAHELRQPLSAIESIAYYLSLVLPRGDEKIQGQLAQLQQLVGQSDWILSNGLHLAEPAAIAPELVNFDELIGEIASARLNEPALRLDLAANLPLVRVDPSLCRELIANLLTLFRQLADESHAVVVRTSSHAGGMAFDLETSAPGYRCETALGPGASLSLASARRIAEAHAGSLECSVDPLSGVRVRVMLP